MEIWRNIKGWDRYQVSNLGNVRSNSWGVKKLMTLQTKEDGYKRLNFTVNRKTKNMRVHRLVAHAFLAMPLDSELTVDHINGIKDDNRLVNLRVVTQYENNVFHCSKQRELPTQVIKVKRTGRYKVTKCYGDKKFAGCCIVIGTYNTIEEAVAARDDHFDYIANNPIILLEN
jgi:hypothetical protein